MKERPDELANHPEEGDIWEGVSRLGFTTTYHIVELFIGHEDVPCCSFESEGKDFHGSGIAPVVEFENEYQAKLIFRKSLE